MTVLALSHRLREEFTDMPGLRLSAPQVRRLYDVPPSTSAAALRVLTGAGFLRALDDGSYRRRDAPAEGATRAFPDTVASPWRRILCVVDFADDSRLALTPASHAALAYATSLGVLHRARVTAMHLVPGVPDRPDEQHAFLEQLVEDLRRHTRHQSAPALIDVHVETGVVNESVVRAARDLHADLIVLGRRDGGHAVLSHLRETPRHARCHVLVVHPSGQAAVA